MVLTVPRGCLESPEWVRAGVGASGFVHPSMLRFRVFRDVWGPRGTPTGPYLPPFGPRVHAG